jgi:hypothetical protein
VGGAVFGVGVGDEDGAVGGDGDRAEVDFEDDGAAAGEVPAVGPMGELVGGPSVVSGARE